MRNRGNVGESTIQGFGGAYGNIGYMGPPLAFAAFGPEAGVAVAFVFCFDNALHFTMAPLLMAFHSHDGTKAADLALQIRGAYSRTRSSSPPLRASRERSFP